MLRRSKFVLPVGLVSLVGLVSPVACDAPGSEPTGSSLDPYSTESVDEFTQEEWAEIRTRCTPAAATEPVIMTNDFRWDYNLADMAARYQEMYVSPKRLKDRAFYDTGSNKLILSLPAVWGSKVVLSPRLVKSVTRHVESALARGHADFVFFPDMGHSHFFIPQARWDVAYADTPVPQIANRYTKFFEDPELKILYHTAEQLVTRDANGPLPDRKLQFRYHTRNIVGDNRAQGALEIHTNAESAANTVKDYEGHRYYGAGFNLSANERGCFHFTHKGRVFYYDISLKDLEGE
jgi:hypothetical protein